MSQGLNSHYFHIIGDERPHQPKSESGFIGPHEIRIPVIKGWMSEHPQYRELIDSDPGTHAELKALARWWQLKDFLMFTL